MQLSDAILRSPNFRQLAEFCAFHRAQLYAYAVLLRGGSGLDEAQQPEDASILEAALNGIDRCAKCLSRKAPRAQLTIVFNKALPRDVQRTSGLVKVQMPPDHEHQWLRAEVVCDRRRASS